MAELRKVELNMSSNSTPSPYIASSSTGSVAYKAFDGKFMADSTDGNYNDVRWHIAGSSGWLSVALGKSIVIAKYKVYPRNKYLNEAPRDWTFEGSNDGSTWHVLDEQSNQTWSSTYDVGNEYSFTNSTAYSNYRLNITANGGSTSYTSIVELELYELNILNKVLISLGGEYKYFDGTQLQSAGTSLTEEVFDTYGMEESVFASIPAAVKNTLIGAEEVFWKQGSEGTIEEDDQLRYRILINGTEKKAWTPFKDPYVTINETLNYTDLKLGSNTIKVEYEDDMGGAGSKDFAVNRINYIPRFESIVVDRTVVHLEDVIITGRFVDEESDNVKYRVLVNGVVTVPWSVPRKAPFDLNVTVGNKLLNFGANTILIEYTDDINNGSWTGNITVADIKPEIALSFNGLTVNATVTDVDSDKVKYRILINGIQRFPVEGWTEFEAPPINIVKTFPSDYVKIKENNTLVIEVIDDYSNSVISKSVDFIGDYAGIMFEDLTGNYFSTDKGDVIKYLTFGTVVAGTATDPSAVFLRNKNGFKITDMQLSKANSQLPKGTTVEFSKTDTPFVPNSTLYLTDVLNYNDKKVFYLRIKVSEDAEPGNGSFDINVTARPVE
jgi:hypothetical protein